MTNVNTAPDDSLKVIYEARRQARSLDAAPPIGKWRHRLIVGSLAGLGVLALAVIVLLWWAAGRVPSLHGRVAAAVVSLAADVDGRLREAFVKPGDTVTVGQKLLALDDTELRAAVDAAAAQEAICASHVEQAQAGLLSTQARIEAGVELARARVQIAEAGVASRVATLALRRAQLPGEIRRAEAERDQARANYEQIKKGPHAEEIEAARLRVATATAQAEFNAAELVQIQQLLDKGFESPFALQTKNLELDAQRNRVREVQLEVSRLELGADTDAVDAAAKALAAREAAVVQARAAEQEIDVLAADVASSQASLREAKAQLASAEAQRSDVEIARSQVDAITAELKKAQAEAAGRRAALAGAVVVSPLAGTVLRVNCQVGEHCAKGEPVVLLADDARGRWLEVYVGERDADRVKVGQRATAEIVVGSGQSVNAVVEAVGLSTNSLGRAATGGGFGAATGEEVWVKLRFENDPPDVLPGLTARAVIHTR